MAGAHSGPSCLLLGAAEALAGSGPPPHQCSGFRELNSGCGSYQINNSLGIADSDPGLQFSERGNYRWENRSPSTSPTLGG